MVYAVIVLKDTHREITPSNRTEALMKSMSTYIWATSTLNQLFIRGSYTQIKISKNELSVAKVHFL